MLASSHKYLFNMTAVCPNVCKYGIVNPPTQNTGTSNLSYLNMIICKSRWLHPSETSHTAKDNRQNEATLWPLLYKGFSEPFFSQLWTEKYRDPPLLGQYQTFWRLRHTSSQHRREMLVLTQCETRNSIMYLFFYYWSHIFINILFTHFTSSNINNITQQFWQLINWPFLTGPHEENSF